MSIANFFECIDCGAPAHAVPRDGDTLITVTHKPECPEVTK